MEEIIFLIVVSIFSAIANRNKKRNKGPAGVERPGSPLTSKPSLRTRSLQSAGPLERTSSSQAENPQGSLGSLIRMLSGEDEAQARRLAREKQDRLYREKAAEEELRIRRETEENERIEAQRLELETRDPDEISDAVEIEELPAEELGETGTGLETVSPMWNISEAQKGIIWREILDGPRSKTRNQPNRRL